MSVLKDRVTPAGRQSRKVLCKHGQPGSSRRAARLLARTRESGTAADRAALQRKLLAE